MSEIIFVRHGQASFGADDYDKLSHLGHQQAAWLAEHFAGRGDRFDRIVCGDLRRHRETAAPIAAAFGEGPEIDARLNEFDYDALAERYHFQVPDHGPAASREEFLHLMPQIFLAWENDALKGATEDFPDFQMRVDDAVDDALASGQRVMIVASGGPIAVTLKRVLGLSTRATAEMLLNIRNASYHQFKYEAGRLRLSQYNAIPHLDPPDRAHALTYI